MVTTTITVMDRVDAGETTAAISIRTRNTVAEDTMTSVIAAVGRINEHTATRKTRTDVGGLASMMREREIGPGPGRRGGINGMIEHLRTAKASGGQPLPRGETGTAAEPRASSRCICACLWFSGS